MLDYRTETFLNLCETMNYTKTAAHLFITQPAVTGHIRFLEEAYGVKLFTYQGKTLTLTPPGEALRRYCLSARADNLQIKKKLAALPGAKDTLHMGATKTIGAFCMSEVTKDYLSLFPENNLCIHVDNTRVLLGLLDAGNIEFALIEGFFESSQYDSLPIAQVNFIGACGASHPLAGKEICFTDLLQHRFILREEGSGTRDIAEAILREYNLQMSDFKQRVETGSFSLIQRLLADNIGFTFVYEPVVAQGIQAGSIVPLRLKDFHASRQFRLVFLKNRLFQSDISQFYDFIRNQPYFAM